jgi:hypothetical protein
MAILNSSLWATHTNDIQEKADFKTRQVAAGAVAIEITVFRDGNKVDQNDFVLDGQQPAKNITVGAESVTLDGQLKLDPTGKLVTFSGNLIFPGQVATGVESMIIAAL